MTAPAYLGRHRRVPVWEAARDWNDAWQCLDAVRDNPATPDRVFIAATDLAFELVVGPVARHVLATGRAA